MRKRLPNGFGQISKLSGNRTNPYMVRLSDRTVVGYAPTYEDAYLMLCKYNKCPWDIELSHATFSDLWDIFLENELPQFSVSRQRDFKSLWKNHLSKLKDKQYASFKTYHFMRFIDSMDTTDNIKNQVVALLKHFDDLAYRLDITEKKYAHELKTKTVGRKSKRRPFTEEEIELLWKHKDDDFVDYMLVMIYTGFRINEFINIKVSDIDTEEWTMVGGSKTEAGKNRIVPIHKRIRPLILRMIDQSKNGKLYPYSSATFGRNFTATQENLGIPHHVPHECRHTLRSRLDSASANKTAIDKILGHKSGGTGEDVYTHKTTKELHANMALIK